MKWVLPSPKSGEKRTIKRFAFLPQEIIEGEKSYIVWFEFYYIMQEFCEGQEYVTRQWKEIERKVRK